jgi:hypothetical protein
MARLGTFSAPRQIRQLSRVQETRYQWVGRGDSMAVLDPLRTFLVRIKATWYQWRLPENSLTRRR